MKKSALLLTVGLFLTNLSLHAYQGEYSGYYGNNYQMGDCCPQPCPQTCCPQDCCSTGTFGVGGDWLYWKTEQTDLIYGSAVSGVAEGIIQASTLSPKFKYHNGWRAFADYTTADKSWKFLAAYTHAPSSARNAFVSSGMLGADFGTLFSANFPIFTAFAQATFSSLNANWSSTTNYLDVTAARAYDLSGNLQITPYLGVRGLWADQTFRLSGIAATDTSLEFSSKLSGKSSGIGLLGGLQAGWEVYEGFSLVGNVGGSLIYTWNRNKGSLLALAGGDVPQTLDISFKNNHNDRGIPMFDTFIGLRYANTWDSFGIGVHVGWEQHVIYDTSDFSLTASGNTTLQGLTLGGSVTF